MIAGSGQALSAVLFQGIFLELFELMSFFFTII